MKRDFQYIVYNSTIFTSSHILTLRVGMRSAYVLNFNEIRFDRFEALVYKLLQ